MSADLLYEAIQDRNLDAVSNILDADPELIHSAGSGDQPLIDAIGCPVIMKLIMSLGADINAEGNDGMTALHCAGHLGALESAQLLVEHGARFDTRDDSGSTPLLTAIYHRLDEELPDYLIQAGAPYDLDAAVARGHAARVREILKEDRDAVSKARSPEYLFLDVFVGEGGHDGDSPLEILQLLFDHGLNVDKETILAQAKQCNKEPILEFLREQAEKQA